MASNPDFIKNRLTFSINVMGYGADSTGTVDSKAAFQAAIDACVGRDYSTLIVPAGRYRIDIPPMSEGGVALLIERLSGLCIRGDGALRGPAVQEPDEFSGTVIAFQAADGEDLVTIGLVIRASSGVRFENLTFLGAPAADSESTRAAAVEIQSITEMGGTIGTTGVQFQNCVFRYCDVCVRTKLDQINNSELSFLDCVFDQSRIGFQPGLDQALVHKFIGCVGGGQGNLPMQTMFDLTEGGNITVVGFGGQQMQTLVKVGAGGANIGWNKFYNVRLENMAPLAGSTRTRIYEAVAAGSAGGSQRTSFEGLIIVADGETDNGVSRFLLLQGHEVQLDNGGLCSQDELALPGSPLVSFPSPPPPPPPGPPLTPGGTFRCYATDIPKNARLDRTAIPAGARYSFQDCQSQQIPYADALDPPIYGPNYLMVVESHCASVSDGLQGVTVYAPDAGNVAETVTPSDAFRAGVISCKTVVNGCVALATGLSTFKLGGGSWRCRLAVRIPTLSSSGNHFTVRFGFANAATSTITSGVFFNYTNDINGGEWSGVKRSPGADDATDLGAPAADTDWHSYEILIDENDVITFYIDGVPRGDPITGVPTAGLALMPVQIERDGVMEPPGDARTVEIDYFRYEFRPTTRLKTFPE